MPDLTLREKVSMWFVRVTMPREDGLPNRLVMWWFPALVGVVLVLFVLLRINGSSTGMFWQILGTGPDPDLLLGTPRAIRSDEWLVQSSWVVSQVSEGFPTYNQILPGGMDATFQNDLPSWDWSTAFRPHLWGFLLMGLDRGMSIRWWLPGFAILVAVYLFVVVLLPKRPVTAALLAGATYFSPILQWWYLPTTLWPVAWAFVGMAGVWWALKAHSGRGRYWWAAATGYLAVTMVMSIYAPFIVPAVLVFLAFTAGAAIRFGRLESVKFVLTRAWAMVIAGAGAAAVFVAWFLTRRDTFDTFFATVYPGQRLEATGSMGREGLYALFAAPWNGALMRGATSGLGPNQSEASTPFMIAAFLAVAMMVLVVRDAWVKRIDWVQLALLAVLIAMFAFLMIRGWDSIAHLTLLDRTTVGRLRLGFLILGTVQAVWITKRLDEGDPISWVGAAGTAFAALAASVFVWRFLRVQTDSVVGAAPGWKIVVALFLVACVGFVVRLAPLASLAFLLASGMVAGLVNPFYRGVFDLRDTQIGNAIEAVEESEPGTWLGVGGWIPLAVLMQEGLPSYDGIQTYPPEQMWENIDPEKHYEEEWNRLAHVYWQWGTGNEVVTNPQRDVIQVSIDPCDQFAQDNVDYIIAETPTQSACVMALDQITEGTVTMWIYEVVPAP